MVDLSVDLNGYKLKTPVIMASGTCGYGEEYGCFFDVKKSNVTIVTKGITLEPKQGNDNDRLYETKEGLINRIGLENIGIKEFIKNIPENIETIVNVAGSTVQDYIDIAKILNENNIKAIELNLSCPNVKEGCIEFGVDEKLLFNVVSAVRKHFNGFLIVKLTPNVTDITKLAISSQKAGANAISAINTVKALGINLKYNKENKIFTKNIIEGGLSGKCIKNIALSQVKKIASSVNIPVIGIGGISTLNDVFEFFSVGAKAVQIGTENFTNPQVCNNIVKELREFMENNGFESINELYEALK